MKILPVHRYKLSNCNTHFKLDLVNLRRLSILLAFALTLIVLGGWVYRDVLFVDPEGQLLSIEHRKSDLQSKIEKYIQQVNKKLPPSEVERYAVYIVKHSRENNIDPFLFAGLARVESRFDRYAVSKVGALGITQIMPEHHPEVIASLVDRFGYCDLFNPEHSIAGGAMILRGYKNIHGSMDKALLRYNGSLQHENPTYHDDVNNAKKKAEVVALLSVDP